MTSPVFKTGVWRVFPSRVCSTRTRFRQILPYPELLLENGENVILSGNFGIADWKSGAEQLIEAADKILYPANPVQRNRTTVGA